MKWEVFLYVTPGSDQLIHYDKASIDNWASMGFSPPVMMIGSLYKPLHALIDVPFPSCGPDMWSDALGRT